MNKQLCYLEVASDFMTSKEIKQIIGRYSNVLISYGIIRCTCSIAEEENRPIFFILSGGVEAKILELVNKRMRIFPHEPVILLTHPENNSLPAALEILARLKQDNTEGRIFQVSSESDKSTITEMLKYASGRKLLKPLSGKTIGLIGAPSDWLIASTPAVFLVENNWGVKVIEITIDEMTGRYREIGSSEIEQYTAKFKNDAVAIIEPDNKDLINAVKIYLALKSIVRDYQLDALSLRCFDLVKNLNTTGCFALAQLNSEGVCASCEGDIVSLLGMIWIKQLIGQIPWMANPAKIDIEQNEILLAHCTIAFNFIENYTIRSHFESGIGVGIKGTIPHVPVTLMRIGGKELNRLWSAEGLIEENTASENLCRTQVKIFIKEPDKLRQLLNDPLGNHLLLIKGSYRKLFLENWKNNYI
jgi:L-fucose isomerase-like protein